MTEALSRRLKQPSFEGPAQEAMLSILVAASTLTERMEHLCAQKKITHAQYNVLRILRGVYPQGHPRGEIACRMIDRAPDITRLLDRLEARRLVRRTRGSEDQRQTVTYITVKGIKLLDAMQPQVELEVTRALSRLNQEDCRQLSRLCAAIFDEHERKDEAQEPGPARDVNGQTPMAKWLNANR